MATNSLNALELVRKHLESPGGSDLLAEMVKTFAETVMSAELTPPVGPGGASAAWSAPIAVTGTGSGRGTPASGTIELAVPKLREGSYFPDWLLQPRRRAEQAFMSVVADAYLAGVSTRRVEKLVQQLGVDRMSKARSRGSPESSTRSSRSSAPGRWMAAPTPT